MDILFNLNTLYVVGASLTVYLARKYYHSQKLPSTDLKGKVVIVTGASDGVGKEAALDFLKRGAEVVFACRNATKTQKIIDSLPKEHQDRATFLQLDLASFKSVEAFQTAFKAKFTRLDILLNNAGLHSGTFKLTEDGLETTMQCNHLSPALLTDRLFSLVEESKGRVVNVASLAYRRLDFSLSMFEERKGFWRDGTWGTFMVYSLSKAMNIMFTKYMHSFAEEKQKKVPAVAVHPGVVRTNIFNGLPFWIKMIVYLPLYPIVFLFTKNVQEGAFTSIFCCTEEENKLESGEMYSDCKKIRLRSYVRDSENIQKAMEYTREVLNEKGYALSTFTS